MHLFLMKKYACFWGRISRHITVLHKRMTVKQKQTNQYMGGPIIKKDDKFASFVANSMIKAFRNLNHLSVQSTTDVSRQRMIDSIRRIQNAPAMTNSAMMNHLSHYLAKDPTKRIILTKDTRKSSIYLLWSYLARNATNLCLLSNKDSINLNNPQSYNPILLYHITYVMKYKDIPLQKLIINSNKYKDGSSVFKDDSLKNKYLSFMEDKSNQTSKDELHDNQAELKNDECNDTDNDIDMEEIDNDFDDNNNNIDENIQFLLKDLPSDRNNKSKPKKKSINRKIKCHLCKGQLCKTSVNELCSILQVDSIQCDKCDRYVLHNTYVYHCNRNSNKFHKDGFDICIDCLSQ